MAVDDGVVHATTRRLSPEVPLSVHLVCGANYAVVVDTGVAAMYDQIRELIVGVVPDPRDVRVIVNTHAHHDHVGCNSGIGELTGALVAASGDLAHWHVDLERHYAEFALGYPELVPDDAAVRHSILADIDAARPLDLHIGGGVVLDLGGGVQLEVIAAPGHLPGELAFLERSTGTLILGDALIGTRWSFFHGYFDVEVYRDTLLRLRQVVERTPVSCLRAAHHPPMTHDEALAALNEVLESVRLVDATVADAAAARGVFALADVWRDTCARHGKALEFRGLRVVDAHVRSLERRGLVRAIAADRFEWA